MAPTRSLDATDRALLNLVQSEFPLDPEPFVALAERAGTTPADVIARLAALKQARVLRGISMIFDTRAIGYRSTLVASRIAGDRVDEAAAIVNAHPGVSHNYRRDHEFNQWWTLAVPPGSSLEDHVEALHHMTGAIATRLMPTIRLFKIGVDFDMTGERAPDARATHAVRPNPPSPEPPPLSPADIALVRALQTDLPLEPRAFAAAAASAGTSEGDLLAGARRLIAEGRARRFGAVLHHREAGFSANGMSVWRVPEDRIEECGTAMAAFAAVSHCYQRPTYSDWPYALFGMLHGRTRDDCALAATAIAEATGLDDYRLLYSTKEYKKVRVRYFTDELAEWERTNLGTSATS